ncbi:zinc-dependent alcohol dehydrogenase [Agathobaculum massiliense]|uniref:zinc-dependent alcohol dehydrogenase n=1 Tax=Agathobaculum massiliense TaxID=3014267 RepID=UPI001FA91BC3|nr:alcohol dehydrogenase catalytic domain-containing protein [Agathobaculum massiliense]
MEKGDASKAMEEKMRAVQIHAPGEFSVDWVPVPHPGRGEVLVEVKAVAICGSDPGIFNGKVLQNGWPPHFPFIAGHEFAAQVVALGEGVTNLKQGDRVAGEAHCGCGTCEMCKKGYYNLCLNYGNQAAGHHHYGHSSPGCYAQYQVYDQKALTLLPDNVTYDEGTLVDTAGTAYNALRLTGVEPGGFTAIIGPGPMGIMAMCLAKAMGSATIVIGRRQRLAMAARLGADYTIDYEKVDDPVEEVRRITGGGAHQVIEAAGNATAYFESVQMARKGGHVALISIPPKDGQEAALKSLIMNQITLHGVRANPNCSKIVLDLMAQGSLNVKDQITHRFPMEQIHEAFDTFIGRKDGALKVIVHPNGDC